MYKGTDEFRSSPVNNQVTVSEGKLSSRFSALPQICIFYRLLFFVKCILALSVNNLILTDYSGNEAAIRTPTSR